MPSTRCEPRSPLTTPGRFQGRHLLMVRLLLPWVHERPGRGGQKPPRLSIARAMRVSGDWQPTAMRMMSWTLVFQLYTRPLVRR